MKILAIDFGEKRTGTAICDEKEILAYPLETILEENEKELVKKITKLAIKNKTEMILVGFAVNMDGSCGEKAKKCENLAKQLKTSLNLPTALWDERQTTKLAQKYMIESKTKKRKKKKIVDGLAATIILESFLQYRKNNGKIKLI